MIACARPATQWRPARATASALEIHIEVDAAEALMLDRQALLTVCRNLVRNAIGHAAPATLTITGGRDGPTFRDNGHGIPAANLPHVFERYRRGHRATTRRPPAFSARAGTGYRPAPLRYPGLAADRELIGIAAASRHGVLHRILRACIAAAR